MSGSTDLQTEASHRSASSMRFMHTIHTLAQLLKGSGITSSSGRNLQRDVK
jgi:hypothetical protein